MSRRPTQQERIDALESRVDALDGNSGRMRRLESAVQTAHEAWDELRETMLRIQSDREAEARFYDLVALICHAVIALAMIAVFAITRDAQLLLLIGGYLGGAAIQKVTTPTKKGT